MRLFLAIEIPERHRLSVERAVQPLRLRIRGARWVPRESWHVTLKFLGEVPEGRLEEVRAIAASVCRGSRPTVSRLTELGVFPSLRRARVLWVGLEDPGGILASAAAALEEAYGRAGFRQESRAWHPHLTVARLRVPGPVGPSLEEADVASLDPSPVEVGEVVLFRSHLSPRGATYEALERFPLGPAEP